jgi:hypothetical protein
MRTRAWILGLAAACVLYAAVAVAQTTLPRENHYKVYRTSPITYVKPVGLLDQFGPIDVTDFVLERFANPAEKIHPETGDVFPIVDPLVHLTWWRIHAPQPARTIIGIDQFGSSEWRLADAVYLLNPALKNIHPDPTGGPLPPIWNHYVCYDAVGPPIGRPVVLIDQFGTSNVVVVQGKLFCNPVEKRVDGTVYPIIDYAAHLACYLINDLATPMTRSITAIDQFGYWQLETYDSDCLCVPALKEHVIGTEESTWGRIKAMYR